VALEIEFEDDDSADPEQPEDRAVPVSRVLMPRPAVMLVPAAAVVIATAVAGLNLGLTAEQSRSRALLHLAPDDSYSYGALPSAGSPTATGSVERTILLRVLNDGPLPVTVLGGTLYAPDIAASRLVPDAGGVVRPGAVGALRAVARISCGGGAQEGADATFAEVSFATVADIELRTADGQVRHVRIIVQQYSGYDTLYECGLANSRT